MVAFMLMTFLPSMTTAPHKAHPTRAWAVRITPDFNFKYALVVTSKLTGFLRPGNNYMAPTNEHDRADTIRLYDWVFMRRFNNSHDDAAPYHRKGGSMFIDTETRARVRDRLFDKYGDKYEFRIERGVDQTAGLWTEEDGDAGEFESFCLSNFIGNDRQLEETFDRFDRVFESIDGGFNAMLVILQEGLHLDLGEINAADRMLGEYDPSAHLTEDFFENKLAFSILLNFPHYSLNEKMVLSEAWSARDWALARLGDRLISRLPASIQQELNRIEAGAEAYIAEYNIYMGNLRDRRGRRLFPENLKLVSHWGIRDELKSQYGREDGLPRQKLISRLMHRIITQDIPEQVINNSELVWNVDDNTVTRNGEPVENKPEPNRRYRHIIDYFKMMRKIDRYYPSFPTFIQRKFDLQREIPEDEVKDLFTELLSSSELSETAGLIGKRLGRDLEPFDIWYDGFKSRSGIDQQDLDRIVGEKYPNLGAFQHDLKNILMALDFSPEQAEFVASKIVVDASRGPGHAWGARMKSEKAHLRTRFSGEGMDYKGFNIAIHELGHNVEQILSLHRVDHHMIQGVPLNGCTEAFAFIFQHRDLELLGMKRDDENTVHLKTLDGFWNTAEIMAVSLVEMKIWRWLYDNPDATPEALKVATMNAAQEIWNGFYAEAFGSRDEIILAIYSHMIDYPLYLADYPLGHIIQFQIERYMEGRNLGNEMERICSTGNILPQEWMKVAVGAEISVKPILIATGEALAAVN